MPVTVRELVERSSLGLRFDPTVGAEGLDAEIAWAHSSDLADPTPWLEPGTLLLTDGSHLGTAAEERIDAAAYAARLRAAGVVGLGFGVGVVHERVPRELVAACRDAGLPLVLVPATMPFIRIIRHVADVAAADRNERLTWSIAAQRAIARAALQPDGLGATLRELEVRLGCWVALYDGLGRRVPVRTRDAPPEELLPRIAEAVDAQLRRGRRAASHLSGGGHDITLQTIGRSERLRGVLAVGTSVPLDPAGNDLLASVIGIASIAIEQGRTLDHARGALRRGVLELLLAGATDAAGRILRELGAWVPGERVRVAVVAGVTAWEATFEDLELRAGGEAFTFARVDDEVVVVWDAPGAGDGASAGPGASAGAGDGGEPGASARAGDGGEPGAFARASEAAGIGASAGTGDAAEPGASARAGDAVGIGASAGPAAPAPVPVALEVLRARGARIGCSDPVPVAEIERALGEARRAVARAAEPGRIVEFAELRARGLVAWLAEADAGAAAVRLLEPLREREDAAVLVESARAWFAANCAWDPAARELGVHRHTLRSRIDALGDAVGLDLGDFGARAELWAALQLAAED